VFADDLAALVFDFDRTLVPLGNFVKWREALPEMLERYRASGVPDELLDAAPRGCFGLYGHVALGHQLDEAELARVQAEVSEVLGRFEAAGIGHAELLPGVEDLLRSLPGFALAAGIVSSNPAWIIRRILEQEGVADCFGAVVGREGLRSIKPSPEGMQRCCALLGVAPERCLGVGDNAGDIEASRAAGMPAVGVATGVSTADALAAAGAMEVFGDLRDLHTALRRWHATRGTS